MDVCSGWWVAGRTPGVPWVVPIITTPTTPMWSQGASKTPPKVVPRSQSVNCVMLGPRWGRDRRCQRLHNPRTRLTLVQPLAVTGADIEQWGLETLPNPDGSIPFFIAIFSLQRSAFSCTHACASRTLTEQHANSSGLEECTFTAQTAENRS